MNVNFRFSHSGLFLKCLGVIHIYFFTNNWGEILLLKENDPMALNNFHQHINYLLDEFAPYKKLSKKDLKLKSKPWINNLILNEMNKRDNLLHKYSKMKNKDVTAIIIYDDYKNQKKITKLKRHSKVDYYHRFL